MLTTFAEAGIEVHEEVVLMTTKGEAIALGIAQMSTVELSSCDHGVVAKVKRCIMERDLYPRRWGLGPTALEKKKLKSDGKLDVSSAPTFFSSKKKANTTQKYGRPNQATPAKWNAEYKDFNAPLENGTATELVGPSAPVSAPPTEQQADFGATEKAAKASSPTQERDSKKRKRHEGETAEERVERKRKKKEKKEKRKSKKEESEEESEKKLTG